MIPYFCSILLPSPRPGLLVSNFGPERNTIFTQYFYLNVAVSYHGIDILEKILFREIMTNDSVFVDAE